MGKFVPSTKGIDYGKRLQTPPPAAAQPTEPTPTDPKPADPKPADPKAKPSPHPHLDRVLAKTAKREGPADYEPQFCTDVVEVMGEGFSLTAFAGAINASRKMLNAWIADHPAFAAAVERGRAARTRALETQFLTAGTGAKVAAHVFALRNAAPEDWRERPDAETATIAVMAANASSFRTDLGVFDPAVGRFMTQAAQGTTPGGDQYTVNPATGGYTFAAADAGRMVKLYYTYGLASGTTVSVTNPLMDCGPVFRADLVQTFRGKQSVLTAWACQSFKLSFPFKQDDFTLPEFDFSAMDDGTGSVLSHAMAGY